MMDALCGGNGGEGPLMAAQHLPTDRLQTCILHGCQHTLQFLHGALHVQRRGGNQQTQIIVIVFLCQTDAVGRHLQSALELGHAADQTDDFALILMGNGAAVVPHLQFHRAGAVGDNACQIGLAGGGGAERCLLDQIEARKVQTGLNITKIHKKSPLFSEYSYHTLPTDERKVNFAIFCDMLWRFEG